MQVSATTGGPAARGPQNRPLIFVAEWPYLAAIGMAVVVVFSQIVFHGFVNWDDDLHITRNPFLNPVSAEGLLALWRAPYEDLYIPVSYTVFAAEAALTDRLGLRDSVDGLDPRVFKVVSLLLHAICCGLVYRFLREWTSGRWAALAGALVFAVHPLQVESVAWTSETRGLLSAAFALAAVLCHGRAMKWGATALLDSDRPRCGTLPHRGWWIAGTICFGLALLSKPSAASVILVAALGDWRLTGRRAADIALGLAPWCLLAILDLGVTKWLQSDARLVGLESVPLSSRLLVAGDALTFYAGKLVWPVGLAIDHGRTPAVVLSRPEVWLTALVAPGAAAVLWWLRVSRTLCVAYGLFVAGLLPVLGLVPFGFQAISTVADRYMYLAMLGPALLIAWAWQSATSHILRGALTLFIGLLGFLSWQQAGMWKDSQTLYAHALKVNPRSWVSLNNQGDLLAKAGRLNEAADKFRQALNVNPRHGRAAHNLGVCLLKLGREKEAEALFRKAVEASPRNSLFQEALAESLLKRGELDLAARHYELAVQHSPKNPALRNQWAEVCMRLGRTDEAESLYLSAIELQPEFWPARVNLGNLYLARGNLDAAMTQFEEALRIQPDQSAVLLNAGLIAVRQQRLDDSVRYLKSAHRLSTNPAERASISRELTAIHNARGLQLSAEGRMEAALVEFQRAIGVEPDFAAGHFNLADVLTRLGRAAEAESHLRKALDSVPPDSQAARDIVRRLESLGTEASHDR